MIESLHGCHVFPDSNALGEGENPQWLYTVRFNARDLWGPDADPNLSVSGGCVGAISGASRASPLKHIVRSYESVCAAKVDLSASPTLAVPVASPAFMALPDKPRSEAR